MTSVFKRMTAIFQAKANKALDRVEDPRETLDLSYEKQLDSLQKVRRSVADVATARKRIELQASQLQQQANKLQQQAKAALSQGNEDLAREALARRAALGEQLEDLQRQHDQVAEQEQRLVVTMQRLQSQVEQFRTRKETLKASYTAAEAQTKIGEAVSGLSTSLGDAGNAMQRAQDKIDGHAGPGRGHRRAPRLRGHHGPQPPGGRHPGRARQGLGGIGGRQPAGRDEGGAGCVRTRRSPARHRRRGLVGILGSGAGCRGHDRPCSTGRRWREHARTGRRWREHARIGRP